MKLLTICSFALLVIDMGAKAGLEIVTRQVLNYEAEAMYERAYEVIKGFEGEKLTAYVCPAGKQTIGVGLTIYPDGSPVEKGDTITQEQSREIFFHYFENRCLPLVAGLNLNANQTIAVCSFIFNVGEGNWKNSTLRKKIVSHPDTMSIRDEFLKWIYATVDGAKVVLKGLENRRKAEADLYFKR